MPKEIAKVRRLVKTELKVALEDQGGGRAGSRGSPAPLRRPRSTTPDKDARKSNGGSRRDATRTEAPSSQKNAAKQTTEDNGCKACGGAKRAHTCGITGARSTRGAFKGTGSESEDGRNSPKTTSKASSVVNLDSGEEDGASSAKQKQGKKKDLAGAAQEQKSKGKKKAEDEDEVISLGDSSEKGEEEEEEEETFVPSNNNSDEDNDFEMTKATRTRYTRVSS
eukprot:2179740-Rhodomonas_salina.2